MKLAGTIGLTALLSVFLAVAAFAAQAPVGLGTATSFAVLAGETITNTGPTTINGDVGLHPGTDTPGFSTVTLNGSLQVNNAVALQAKNDLVTAYNDAAGRTPVTTVATELGGTTPKAGVYDSSSGTFGLTGDLTLDAEGDPNAVFIFHTVETLITAPGSKVLLINGAQACNVFWKVGSSATLDTTTSFKGNILALTSIGLLTGATLEGRAFARNGAVTMQTNVITRPTCLTSTPTTPTTPSTPTVAGTGGTTPAPDASSPTRRTGRRTTTGTGADLPRTGVTIPAWPAALLAILLISLGRPMARMPDVQAGVAWRAFTYKPRHRRSRRTQ